MFISETHAKWILAGEHAVVRGHSAIVFPMREKTMTLRYEENQKPLSLQIDGEKTDYLDPLFWRAFEEGLKKIHQQLTTLTGTFSLMNNIPLGSGLGASAALCINIGRFFVWKNWIVEPDLFHFARSLEDVFHGKSSGLDLVGSLYNAGVYFSPQQPPYPLIEPIKARWQPHWSLSFSGKIGITSECVQQVQQLHQDDPALAKQLDIDMENAVQLAKKALESDQSIGLPLLIKAINQACECFSAWGLINPAMATHIQHLKESGALAVKPTGSGNGGYLLSLMGNEYN